MKRHGWLSGNPESIESLLIKISQPTAGWSNTLLQTFAIRQSRSLEVRTLLRLCGVLTAAFYPRQPRDFRPVDVLVDPRWTSFNQTSVFSSVILKV